jgi:ribosomal protein L37AE/L43A
MMRGAMMVVSLKRIDGGICEHGKRGPAKRIVSSVWYCQQLT